MRARAQRKGDGFRHGVVVRTHELMTDEPKETGGEDFLAVIDVDVASPSYGKILERVGVGSTGNVSEPDVDVNMICPL